MIFGPTTGISTAEDITACMRTYCYGKPIDSGWLGSEYPQEMSRTIYEPDSIIGSVLFL